jgi:hypothetical protein
LKAEDQHRAFLHHKVRTSLDVICFRKYKQHRPTPVAKLGMGFVPPQVGCREHQKTETELGIQQNPQDEDEGNQGRHVVVLVP